jgi:two-component system chemotaxis response regulator CheY
MPQEVKVLLVEDSGTMRAIIKNTLKLLGYRAIEEAANGNEALSKILNTCFDVVIMDWYMPAMSGFDVLKQVRADQLKGKTPILMLTSESERECVITALAAGATDYIVKPFGEEILSSKLQNILKDRTPAKPART